MKKISLLLFFAALIISLINCQDNASESLSPEATYNQYCGNCHLTPNPAHLTKAIWEENVLPEMAARLGYSYNDYNPLKGNSMMENLKIRESQIYPEKPVIDSIEWKKIYDYVMSLAPDELPTDTTRNTRNEPLTQFKAKSISIYDNQYASVTSIQFDKNDNYFLIGDASGVTYTYPTSNFESQLFRSPITSNIQKDGKLYVTEVGIMNPSQQAKGKIHVVENGESSTIAENIHRPVYTEVVDLDENGTDEILVCEFGNITGQLSILVNNDGVFEKSILLPQPGTIKVDMQDMNNDGKKDIVVLASQGKEGIYILYQRDNLKFRPEQVIELGSEYGSSWFEMVDFNGDGHLDIILANGDNADLSVILKPYHGVRIYLNDGKNNFSERWFYPIYGATRLVVDDFDKDNDLDFGVLSFFPNFQHSLEESFIYFENIDATNFKFKTYTTPESTKGRWLTMDKGDFDKDGDVDIILAAFTLPPKDVDKNILKTWRESEVELLLLENE